MGTISLKKVNSGGTLMLFKKMTLYVLMASFITPYLQIHAIKPEIQHPDDYTVEIEKPIEKPIENKNIGSKIENAGKNLKKKIADVGDKALKILPYNKTIKKELKTYIFPKMKYTLRALIATGIVSLLIIRPWRWLFGKPEDDDGIKRGYADQKPTNVEETSKDIAGGLPEEMENLFERIKRHKDPNYKNRFNLHVPKGILLHGPPGTGKTLMAKVSAKKLGAKLFYFSGSDLRDPYEGGSVIKLDKVFDAAIKASSHSIFKKGANLIRKPFGKKLHNNNWSIIFFDEIDGASAGKNNSKGNESGKIIERKLQSMFDKVKNRNIIIIGATNYPKKLSKALLRPGRFDRKIKVPRPTEEQRCEIIKLHAKKHNVTLTNEQVEEIAKKTKKVTGAGLEKIIEKSAETADNENKEKVSSNHLMSAVKWLKSTAIGKTKKRKRRVTL